MSEKQNIQQVIVADIGGTNARFAIASLTVSEADGDPTASMLAIDHYIGYSCADFHEPQSLVQTYLNDCPVKGLDTACFAVAGPADGKTAYLTNLGWRFDSDKLSGATELNTIIVANDFAALARSITAIDPQNLISLHHVADAPKDGPKTVMGPGTGFGIAQVIQKNGQVTVIPTEGGHSAFVPSGELETKVWDMVRESMGHVTVETFLSGIGILRIYRAICTLNDMTPLNYEPSTISQLAIEHSDPACVDTLNVFCAMLGGVASDMAMTTGSIGGIYLGGGILPKIVSFVEKSQLVEHYLHKPPMQKYVEQIPLSLIMDPEAALIGAALLAEDTLAT